MPYPKLAKEIIKLSESNTWEVAVREWVLLEIYIDEPDTCLCGHHPIKEICVLENKVNGITTIVGNCCVKRFLGLPSDKMFQAIKRVKRNNDKSFNDEIIQDAYDKKTINSWEENFYSDTMRKRNLTFRQLNKKIEINKKILSMYYLATPDAPLTL